MRDKDTKILEEAYSNMYDLGPEETHDNFGAKSQDLNTVMRIANADEVFEDVPMNVEFDVYKGSTPAGGDDPTSATITSVVVADDVYNDKGAVAINAGTTLKELKQLGFMFNTDGLQDSVDEYITYDM